MRECVCARCVYVREGVPVCGYVWVSERVCVHVSVCTRGNVRVCVIVGSRCVHAYLCEIMCVFALGIRACVRAGACVRLRVHHVRCRLFDGYALCMECDAFHSIPGLFPSQQRDAGRSPDSWL